MRAIKKIGNGGNRLNKAHTKPPATPAEASSRWGHFRDKKQVQQCLLKEQYQLCCYSELRADEQDLGYHIEHLENKSQNPSRTFDYSNLAASALAQPDDLTRRGYQKHETFGGHATDKQQSVDLARFVSCHQADCQRYFAYLCDGRVIPAGTLNVADTDRAQYTIDLLNLNSPYLITLRQKWYGELEEVFEKHKEVFEKHKDEPSTLLLIKHVLLPQNQTLNRFFSLTRQFFDLLAEQTLQRHLPELI